MSRTTCLSHTAVVIVALVVVSLNCLLFVDQKANNFKSQTGLYIRPRTRSPVPHPTHLPIKLETIYSCGDNVIRTLLSALVMVETLAAEAPCSIFSVCFCECLKGNHMQHAWRKSGCTVARNFYQFPEAKLRAFIVFRALSVWSVKEPLFSVSLQMLPLWWNKRLKVAFRWMPRKYRRGRRCWHEVSEHIENDQTPNFFSCQGK